MKRDVAYCRRSCARTARAHLVLEIYAGTFAKLLPGHFKRRLPVPAAPPAIAGIDLPDNTDTEDAYDLNFAKRYGCPTFYEAMAHTYRE